MITAFYYLYCAASGFVLGRYLRGQPEWVFFPALIVLLVFNVLVRYVLPEGP